MVLTKNQIIIIGVVVTVVVVGIIAGIVLSKQKDPATPATTNPSANTNPSATTNEDPIIIMSSDQKVVITDKQKFLFGAGAYGQKPGCWTLDDVQEWKDKLKTGFGGNCDVTSIKLPADIKATAHTVGTFATWNDMCTTNPVFDIPAGTTKEFKSGSVCGFKFSKA